MANGCPRVFLWFGRLPRIPNRQLFLRLFECLETLLVAKIGLRKEQGMKIERENKVNTYLENPGVHQDSVQMPPLYPYTQSQVKQRK